MAIAVLSLKQAPSSFKCEVVNICKKNLDGKEAAKAYDKFLIMWENGLSSALSQKLDEYVPNRNGMELRLDPCEVFVLYNKGGC